MKRRPKTKREAARMIIIQLGLACEPWLDGMEKRLIQDRVMEQYHHEVGNFPTSQPTISKALHDARRELARTALDKKGIPYYICHDGSIRID